MAFSISGKDCMVSEWILLLVSYVFVGLRIRIRTRPLHGREKWNWSDYLLVLAAISALGLIICDSLTYSMGVMDNYKTSVNLSKISLASNYFYDVGMGFPKMSMLAFYWSYSLPPTNMGFNMRKVLYWITGFVYLAYFIILLDDTFFCGMDISVQWSQEQGACSVFYALEPFILNFTLDLACYIMIYAFSLTLLIQGIIQPSAGVTTTFGLGALTICTIIVRFITLKVGTGQENLVYPLSMLEMALAITVVALPGLKPGIKLPSEDGSISEIVEEKL